MVAVREPLSLDLCPSFQNITGRGRVAYDGLCAHYNASAIRNNFRPRGVHQMHRNEESRLIWREVYPELSEGKPGLLGAVTSRAEAQTMRLACIYALLDSS